MTTYLITAVSKDKNDNIIKIRGYQIYENNQAKTVRSYEDLPENLAQELIANSISTAFTARIIKKIKENILEREEIIPNPNSQIEVIKKPDGSHYLRTSANCKEEDNLDNLPTF